MRQVPHHVHLRLRDVKVVLHGDGRRGIRDPRWGADVDIPPGVAHVDGPTVREVTERERECAAAGADQGTDAEADLPIGANQPLKHRTAVPQLAVVIRIGQRVAAKGVTVVDDGTLSGRRGSLNMDDEGTPTQCTTLIEDGVLKGYIQDSLNARLMKMPLTGNGRRESFASLPLPRMTNTYMLSGHYDPQEIVASIDRGLYAVNFGGGQVDITSGKFVFSASVAYWVEKGKIQYPVKGATIIGNGPESLKQVSMIGNDLRLDSGVGVCGKEGQSVPVGVGQPTLRIDEMTVGGTA